MPQFTGRLYVYSSAVRYVPDMSVDCLFIQSPFTAQGILPHSDSHTVGEGLLSISTFLRSKGFSTDIFCADELFLGIEGFKFDRSKITARYDIIRDKIREAAPRVVAISALTPQYPKALEIAALAKEVDPGTAVIIGGPHVTYTDRDVFRDSPDIDVVVRGEGEWTMLDIAEHVKLGRGLDDVLGITFRKDGKVISNPARPFGDLTTLPPVDYSQVNPEYLKKCGFFLTFTRGCPFNCSYCLESKMWGQNVRHRGLDALIKEIKYIVANYPAASISFLGSVFNAPEKFFIELCGRLKDIDLSGNDVGVLVGAAYLPEEHVRLMKEAGIKKLMIAVESAAPEILKRMNKKISFDLVAEKCALIKKYGLEVGTFWLFGHPGETEETARISLDAMVYLWEKDLNDKQEVAIFTPYPGLPLLNDPAKEGFRLLQNDFSKFSRFDGPVVDLSTISIEKMRAAYKEARETAQNWLSFKRDLFAGSMRGKKE